MEDLKDVLKVLLGFLGGVTGLWLFLKLLSFLHERGWTLGGYDPSHEPGKVEIQTLFHGNTKDEDQI